MVLETSSRENTCFGRSEPAGLAEEQRSELRPTPKTFSAPQNLLRHFEVILVSGVALLLLAASSDGLLVLFVMVTVFAVPIHRAHSRWSPDARRRRARVARVAGRSGACVGRPDPHNSRVGRAGRRGVLVFVDVDLMFDVLVNITLPLVLVDVDLVFVVPDKVELVDVLVVKDVVAVVVVSDSVELVLVVVFVWCSLLWLSSWSSVSPWGRRSGGHHAICTDIAARSLELTGSRAASRSTLWSCPRLRRERRPRRRSQRW